MDPAIPGQRASRERATPSQRVVEAVAAAEGCAPLDLDVPFYDVVDPDALDALVDRGGSDGGCSVSFVYLGHDVEVRPDGSVAVDGG